MAVSHVEVLVEEPSMEAALRVLLPRVLGELSFEVYSHQCKDDLLRCLPDRLRGYAAWLPDDYRIVVVVDRDDDDCLALKQRLEQMASDAQLRSRSNAGDRPYQVVNRLTGVVVLWRLGRGAGRLSQGTRNNSKPGKVPRSRCDCGRHVGSIRARPETCGIPPNGFAQD